MDQDSVFKGFWNKESWIEEKSPKTILLLIIIAGFLGGTLAESAAAVSGSQWTGAQLSWGEAIGLGFAAAGVGTLVVANTRRNDYLSFFFFALLCAISFPAVIKAGMEDLWEKETENTASQAKNAKTPNEYAATLGRAKELAPESSALPVKQAVDLEVGLIDGIKAIEDTSVTNSRDEAVQVIEEAKEFGESAGFERLADQANEALTRLRSSEAPTAISTGEAEQN